ncbi:phosphohydrolase [Haladaptatus sp. R4]|uniref:HD domain-containing protein n=1 Tax=Haladaptatus sp. R4 TaxID=1679489 RepID=UPI0007B4660E|nr:HD domain-containing protein [Haladaptatus sp. R4]KZN25276.1 phosphohydrolase [Haladaptatus sp. R4]
MTETLPEAVRPRVKPYFENVAPAHDWHHVQRVANLAETLAAEYDPDGRILFSAVWLHDIGRGREDRGEIEDHAEWGAEEAKGILAEFGAAEHEIRAVQHCIRAHRFSNDVEPETLEAKLLSDADNLDALGAVGIARVFCYGGEHRNTMHDPGMPLDADETRAGATSMNHFHKKILRLPSRMYTDAGRRVADERRAFVETFIDRFEREVDGEC